jgi:hypothetical protein
MKIKRKDPRRGKADSRTVKGASRPRAARSRHIPTASPPASKVSEAATLKS